MIHGLQPATLVNDRIGVPARLCDSGAVYSQGHSDKGRRAHAAPIRSVSEKLRSTVPRPEDFQLWETCMTINNTWAYNKNDHDYKSASRPDPRVGGSRQPRREFPAKRRTAARRHRSSPNSSSGCAPSANGLPSTATRSTTRPTAQSRASPVCEPPPRTRPSTCTSSTGRPPPASSRASRGGRSLRACWRTGGR